MKTVSHLPHCCKNYTFSLALSPCTDAPAQKELLWNHQFFFCEGKNTKSLSLQADEPYLCCVVLFFHDLRVNAQLLPWTNDTHLHTAGKEIRSHMKLNTIEPSSIDRDFLGLPNSDTIQANKFQISRRYNTVGPSSILQPILTNSPGRVKLLPLSLRPPRKVLQWEGFARGAIFHKGSGKIIRWSSSLSSESCLYSLSVGCVFQLLHGLRQLRVCSRGKYDLRYTWEYQRLKCCFFSSNHTCQNDTLGRAIHCANWNPIHWYKVLFAAKNRNPCRCRHAPSLWPLQGKCGVTSLLSWPKHAQFIVLDDCVLLAE